MFLRPFFATVFILLVTIAIFNGFIDSYGLIDTPRIYGINARKPHIMKNARTAKAFAVRKIKPDSIILGSSRSETGINPDNSAWPISQYGRYNLSFPSARINEIYAYLRHAQAQRKLRHVVLGLDLFMFDPNFRNEINFDIHRLDIDETNVLLNSGMREDLVTALLSYDALVASFDTIRSQRLPVDDYIHNGLRNSEFREAKIRELGGYSRAFSAELGQTLRARDGAGTLTYLDNLGNSPDTLETFENLVKFCNQQNIALYIFISPIHVYRQELFRQLGMWPQFEQWKRDLVKILSAAHFDSQRGSPTLLDYATANYVTTESVPSGDDQRIKMSFYWEASHYKVSAGNIILQELFSNDDRRSTKSAGIPLNRENIENHLLKARNAHKEYLLLNPQSVHYITKSIAEHLPGRSLDNIEVNRFD